MNEFWLFFLWNLLGNSYNRFLICRNTFTNLSKNLQKFELYHTTNSKFNLKSCSSHFLFVWENFIHPTYLNWCSYLLARLQRHVMTENDLKEVCDKVPGLKKGSSQLFRTLRDKGIISYTEYLFLLSVLTSE